MNCPSCDAANREGRVYCGRCSGVIAARCQRCAFVNDLECTFCGGCACQLTAAAHPAPPVGTANTAEVGMLALEQFNELLRTAQVPDELPAPRRLGSQEEVDRLFGAGS
jgi:hypothetical protein